MLNIIIRTSHRPEAFRRCYDSARVILQNTEHRFIIGYDNLKALEYIPHDKLISKVNLLTEPKIGGFFYNRYLNTLLKRVLSGHCIFLDDDDEMVNSPHFDPGYSYVVPFLRGTFQKPNSAMMQAKSIKPGYIGLPSLVLWHRHIPLVDFDGTELADYKAILTLSKKVELKWKNSVVVRSEKRNFGALEK